MRGGEPRAARLRPLHRVARSQANIVIISCVLCKAELSIQLRAVALCVPHATLDPMRAEPIVRIGEASG